MASFIIISPKYRHHYYREELKRLRFSIRHGFLQKEMLKPYRPMSFPVMSRLMCELNDRMYKSEELFKSTFDKIKLIDRKDMLVHQNWPVCGRFFADFWIRGRNKLIEIDGSYHDDEEVQLKDHNRQEVLRCCGYRVLRLNTRDSLEIWTEKLQKFIRPKVILRRPKPK